MRRNIFRRGAWLQFFLTLALLSPSGCEQNPQSKPKIKRVYPDLIGNLGARFLIVDGEDFLPVSSWPAAGGEPQLRFSFSISIDGSDPVEPTVLGTGRLAFLVPEGLAGGHHSITVTGPDGSRATLADAFCVDDDPQLELIYTCRNDGLDLCASSLDDSQEPRRVVVENTVAGVWEGAGDNQTDTLQNGYDLSPDGGQLAFLRISNTGSERQAQIMLADLDEGWEVKLFETVYPPDVPENYRLLSAPVFSPDGARLAYVRNFTDLMLQTVPHSPDSVEEAVVFYSEPKPEEGEAYLMYPDFDPGDRYLLFTRVVDVYPNESNDDLVSMHLAPLDGDPVFRLLQPVSGLTVSKDGPGAFTPSGDRIVFLSDRSFLNIPTPFGTMAPAIRLYSVDLQGGQIEALGMTTAAYLYGKPVISSNRRLVAANGFLADLSGSGLDIVIADLFSGLVSRAGKDPVKNCFPADAGEDCKLPDSDLEYSLACCADLNSPGTCCQFNLGACPTWNLAPTFSPDSRIMAANAISVEWRCVEDTVNSGDFYWRVHLRDFYLILSELNPDGSVYRETSLSTGLLDFPTAPQVREVLECPVERQLQ